MKPVEIYTSPLCGYCHMAKRLLNSKGVSFVEVDVLANPEKKAEMARSLFVSIPEEKSSGIVCIVPMFLPVHPVLL